MPRYVVTTQPSRQALTLDEAKNHLRVTDNEFDGQIAALIEAAGDRAQNYTGRYFINQGVTLYLDQWPSSREVLLWRVPVTAVVSVTYYDEAGVLQTFDSADYWTALNDEPAAIVLKDGAAWPTLQSGRPEAIQIALTCGYGASPDNVPALVRAGILQIVEDMFSGLTDGASRSQQVAGWERVLAAYRFYPDQ